MDSRFPLRLIVIAATVTVLTTLFVTAIFSINHSHTLESEARNIELKELSGKILLYDEQLTSTTRLAAFSGDRYWLQRYDQVVELLDGTIAETLNLAGSVDILGALQSTESANTALIDLETRAFDAIEQGDKHKALELLDSDTYEVNKVAYSKGMENVLALIDQEREATRAALQRRFLSVVAVVAAGLFFSSVLWLFVYRAVVRWRRRFSEEQAKRTKAELEIHELNQDLELRISKRTAELETSRQQLSHQANHDELTGLPNRRNVMDKLTQQLSDSYERIYVMMIDLDHFKRVNDSLGHASGDAILKQAAQRFTGALNEDSIVARLGGDEFLIVQKDTEDADVSSGINSILQAFQQPFYIFEREYRLPLSPSIGVAVAPKDGTILEDIVRNADIAMYAAKQQGRNSACFFIPEMIEKTNRKISIESDLRDALVTSEEFELYYQPQVNLTDQSIFGVEALLRWKQPDQGMIFPDQFIPIAEDTGLIVDLGRWVLYESARQYRQWQDTHGISLNMSINVASQQLAIEGFDKEVLGALTKYRVPAEHFGIEITERSLIGNDEQSRHNLHMLNQMGVQLSLDDFGSGYSALRYLNEYPFDHIKIDKTFIDSISESKNRTALVEGIIRMSRSIDLIVVGEGIETVEQSDLLHSFGCDIAQGYHYGRPLPADELIALVKNWGLADSEGRFAA